VSIPKEGREEKKIEPMEIKKRWCVVFFFFFFFFCFID